MAVGEQDCEGLMEITTPVYIIKKKKARKAMVRKKQQRKAAK